MLDLVETFIEPRFSLWSSHFISKPSLVGRRVPWHEYSSYWNSQLSGHEVIIVWLGNADSTKKSGCMRLNPGTHVFIQDIVPDQRDESKTVDLEVRAGECHLHHAETIHGPNPNASTQRRCRYTMHHMPAGKVNSQPEHPFAIYLARGKGLAVDE